MYADGSERTDYSGSPVNQPLTSPRPLLAADATRRAGVPCRRPAATTFYCLRLRAAPAVLIPSIPCWGRLIRHLPRLPGPALLAGIIRMAIARPRRARLSSPLPLARGEEPADHPTHDLATALEDWRARALLREGVARVNAREYGLGAGSRSVAARGFDGSTRAFGSSMPHGS